MNRIPVVALTLVAAALITSCSAVTKSSTDVSSRIRPVGVNVTLDSSIAGRTESVSTGLSTSKIGSDGSATVKIDKSTAGLVSAKDAAGNLTAVAVAISPGTITSSVRMNYESTAFARLMLSPGFISSEPLIVALFRGIAEESPAFHQLAHALEVRAATDVRYLDSVTSEEMRLLLELQADVLLAIKREINGTQSIASRKDNDFRITTISYSSNSKPRVGASCDVGLESLGEPGSAGLCATLLDKEVDPAPVRFENKGNLWAALLDGEDMRYLIPSRTIQIPDLQDLLEKLLQNVVGRVAALVLIGVESLGRVEIFNEEKFLGDLFDLTSLKQITSDGFAQVEVTKRDLDQGLYAVTLGSLKDPNLNRARPDTLDTTLYFMTLMTQTLLPLGNLVSGIRSSNIDGSNARDLFPKVPVQILKTFDAIIKTGVCQDATNRLSSKIECLGKQVKAIFLDPEFSKWFFSFYSDLTAMQTKEAAKLAAQAFGWIALLNKGSAAAEVVIRSVMTYQDRSRLTDMAGWRISSETEVVFKAPDCEGCKIAVEGSSERFPLVTIKNGEGRVKIDSKKAPAVYFAVVSTPDDRDFQGAQPWVVVQYAGIPAGKEVDSQTARRQRRALVCWAVPDSTVVTLTMSVLRWSYDNPIRDLGESGFGISAWLSPQQKATDSYSPTRSGDSNVRNGGTGGNGSIACPNP